MFTKALGSGFSPVHGSSSGGNVGGDWSTVSINGNGTFTLPSIGTFPLPSPGEMKKIPLQGDKFFKIRQRADGSYEGKFGPSPSQPSSQPAPAPPPPPPAPKLESSFFQPQPQPKAPEHPAVTAAVHFAQNLFQPAPQPQPKAPEPKPASSSFAPKLTQAVKLAQAAFQPAPAPSSGGWSNVAINRNGTFTLPLVGTFPLPAPGEMKKIPLQGDKFFKIRQRADGAYEGKFGPDSLPAPQQPLPARLEERKKDAGGWAQIAVSPDGMIRVPGIAQPLYRPMPGQTQSVPVDAKTTFKFRRGEDGDVYGTFETKAPSQPAPGWQRVNVSSDGMIRLPNYAQPLYRPKPGQTESVQIDARTTFKYREAEDGEVHGTFETKARSQPPPGWERVNVDPDGMIRLPGHAKSFYPPQPGKSESIQFDDKTTFLLSHAEDGEIYGTFETAPPEDQPGLEVDDSKREYEGVVSTRLDKGQKVVDIGSLGTLVAPPPGGHDSYLMGEDKLLVLHGKADGTVQVSTRKLGIESKSDGFKGAVLPSEGKLEFAGHVFDVSNLQPGQKIKKEMRIEGEKFKVEVRMNHDGSVTVTGKQNKSLWEKALSLAGMFLPILGLIPGLGALGVAAKVLGVFNAAKNLVQSIKNGNALGVVSSAAGALAGLSQGAFQAFASKVANLANVGQQVISTIKHGLGNGLLQVVSNGANLVSGIARAAGDLGQGVFRTEAYNVAQTAGGVAEYAGGADRAINHGDLMPIATTGARDLVQHVVSNQNQPAPGRQTGTQNPSGGQESVHNGTQLTPLDPTTVTLDPGAESGEFSSFTPGDGIDDISNSTGQDDLVGDGEEDLVAGPGTGLTPQQHRLISNGSKNYSPQQLIRALAVADNLAQGGTLSIGIRDFQVTRQQVAAAIATLENAVSRRDYLGLRFNDLTSLGQDPNKFYPNVLATLKWIHSNFAAFSALNPDNGVKVGPVNIDFTNSGGRRSMVDLSDINVLMDKNLLKQEAGGGVNFQKLLGDLDTQMKAYNDSINETRRAVTDSGGTGSDVVTFNRRRYGNRETRMGADKNYYDVYQQLDVPAGQPRHELWWTPVPTPLIPSGEYREYQK